MCHVRRVLEAGLTLVPGALVAVLAFQAGGYFASSWSTVAAVAAVALALRVLLAERPFAGVSRPAAVALGALALLAVWTLLSATWSHAPARALLEFDRLLAYGLVLLLLAAPGGSPARAAGTLRGVLAGIAIVCAYALATRLAPDLWAAPASALAGNRLSYPITYWNGLGLLAGVGLILAFHVTASAREPAAARVAAAALAPTLACTLYFTFSRGALWATACGLLIYIVVGRPRAGLTALASAGLATLVAVGAAYDAVDLSTSSSAAAALAAGHRLGTTLLVCSAAAAVARAVLLIADGPLDRLTMPARARRAAGALLALACLAGVAALLAVGAAGWVQRQADAFLYAPSPATPNLRDRLLNVSNTGRTAHWRVALDAFGREPWHGTGAGTFALEWSQRRPGTRHVLDAHSLYLETLGELGLPGALLLGTALVALLGGLARRARGPARGVPAAALAAAAAWAIHAGVDWDWELAAVSIWVFGLAGAVLAAPAPATGASPLGRPLRMVLALGLLALAVPTAQTAISQSRLQTAVDALQAGRCPQAIDAALGSLAAVGQRPEPLEVIAYCDVRLGAGAPAMRAIRQAVARDPRNWELHYGQALVDGSQGRDPRPAIARALALNPHEPLILRAARALRGDRPDVWSRRARRLSLPLGERPAGQASVRIRSATTSGRSSGTQCPQPSRYSTCASSP